MCAVWPLTEDAKRKIQQLHLELGTGHGVAEGVAGCLAVIDVHDRAQALVVQACITFHAMLGSLLRGIYRVELYQTLTLPACWTLESRQ